MTENDRSPFLPILITLLTLIVWFGFQTSQLLKDKNNLSTLATNQETLYKNSRGLRGQLDALASGTSKLAQQGNTNAQKIVSALAQRGITIKSNELSKAPGK